MYQHTTDSITQEVRLDLVLGAISFHMVQRVTEYQDQSDIL